MGGSDGAPVLDQPQQAEVSVSAEQAAALADGRVTRDEYDAGFRRFSSCLEEEGFTLVDVREEYQVINFGVPADAVESGIEDECYSFEFRQLDGAWQISVEDQGEYAILFGECLAERGLDSGGTKLEKEERLREAGITIDECLSAEN